jgi:hypothetical protein
MFGTRGAKAVGAAVNEIYRHNLDALLHQGMVNMKCMCGWHDRLLVKDVH